VEDKDTATESNEPETEDVEGHRFKSEDDRIQGDREKQAPAKLTPGLATDEDVEAHQFAPGQTAPGQAAPGEADL
jgi:hypothetical protein